ncbi:hypothetical protein KI387_026680, partial [Taxus chinensis]
TTSTPTSKKAKTTSRLVSNSKGQQYLEITKPRVENDEKDITIVELELTGIPLGEYTPDGEVHNLKEMVSKVIERVEKGKQIQEQLAEK